MTKMITRCRAYAIVDGCCQLFSIDNASKIVYNKIDEKVRYKNSFLNLFASGVVVLVRKR